MPDVIQLLPDAIANRIAAGEVIQRPASALKELLENAIDAAASEIKVIIKDAGKTLIQVTDNGSGMSETDALRCFERHATSKIREAEDLFRIRSMGFRGEALASIAAIARVELRTRRKDDELGTEVVLEGSETLLQQPCQTPQGSSIAVKNLFFNTPARRQFLKSDQVEKKHLLNEFVRVALAQPGIAFSMYQNRQITHQLKPGNLKQRIIALFGTHYNQRLVPVEEHTDLLQVYGFVFKPSHARKSREEQCFFVNRRFIRSPYLNHAVDQAYEELIPEGMHPSFYLFLELDPETIDVNVHPTKTEIKFRDEKVIYQIIKSVVKRSLGKYHMAPSLDFDRETAFDDIPDTPTGPVRPPTVKIDPTYNPFQTGASPGKKQGSLISRINPRQWENLFDTAQGEAADAGNARGDESGRAAHAPDTTLQDGRHKFIQLHNRYILAPVKSGLMVIDQQGAHERILFERYVDQLDVGRVASQQLLFPENIRLASNDADILKGLIDEISSIGFDISPLKKNTFVVNAVPADLEEPDGLQDLLEGILENYKINKVSLKDNRPANLARSLAKRRALKAGRPMSEEEMTRLTEDLFACKMPYHSPAGKPTVAIIPIDELTGKFK